MSDDWTQCDVELPPVGVEVIAKSSNSGWWLPQKWTGKRWESIRGELYLRNPTHWRPLRENE